MKQIRFVLAALFLLLACAIVASPSRAAGLGPGAWVQYHPPVLTESVAWQNNVPAALVVGIDESAQFVDLTWVDPDPSHVVNGRAPVLSAESVPSVEMLLVTALAVHYNLDLEEAIGVATDALMNYPSFKSCDELHGFIENQVMSQYTPRDPPPWPPSDGGP